MRPPRPFCGTVSNAQLLTLPGTISASMNGVVTTQLSFLPPASSTATEVLGSSDSLSRHRAAAGTAAHHHEIIGIRHAYFPQFPRFLGSKAGLLRRFWQVRSLWADPAQ